MKMISVYQPWASLLAAGVKLYETRHWTIRYRGIIGVHASKRWTANERNYAYQICSLVPTARRILMPDGVLVTPPLGCVLSAHNLEAIFETDDIADLISEEERILGNYSPGRFAWKLPVVKLPDAPIPARGQPGIWEWNRERRD